MPVPFVDALSAPQRRGSTRGKYHRSCARHRANILIGYQSLLVFGCPRQPPDTADVGLSSLQQAAADNLEDELLRYIRSERGVAASALAGGRAHLAERLVALSEAAPGCHAKAPDVTTALPVDPDRSCCFARSSRYD